jgi:hypothetical protein
VLDVLSEVMIRARTVGKVVLGAVVVVLGCLVGFTYYVDRKAFAFDVSVARTRRQIAAHERAVLTLLRSPGPWL